jgi:hypothetical protein
MSEEMITLNDEPNNNKPMIVAHVIGDRDTNIDDVSRTEVGDEREACL